MHVQASRGNVCSRNRLAISAGMTTGMRVHVHAGPESSTAALAQSSTHPQIWPKSTYNPGIQLPTTHQWKLLGDSAVESWLWCGQVSRLWLLTFATDKSAKESHETTERLLQSHVLIMASASGASCAAATTMPVSRKFSTGGPHARPSRNSSTS
jgi:hypothetical protein